MKANFLILFALIVCATSQLQNQTLDYTTNLFPASTLSFDFVLTTTKYEECNAFPLCITYSNSTSQNQTCVNSCEFNYETDVCEAPSTGVEQISLSVLYNTQEKVDKVELITKSAVVSTISCSERFGSCSDEVLGFLQSTPDQAHQRAAIVFYNSLSTLDDVANAFLQLTIIIKDELVNFSPLTQIYGNYGCLPIGSSSSADFPVTEAGEGSYIFSLNLKDFQTYGTGYYYFFIENDHKFQSISYEYSFFWQVLHL